MGTNLNTMSKRTSRTFLKGHNRHLKQQMHIKTRDNRLTIQMKNEQLRKEKIKNMHMKYVENSFLWKFYIIFNRKLKKQIA